jgi:hypothetical protein
MSFTPSRSSAHDNPIYHNCRNGLMSVNRKQPVQLVFSTIDQEVIPHGQVDSLWQPQFYFDGKLKFLGPLAAPQPTQEKG